MKKDPLFRLYFGLAALEGILVLFTFLSGWGEMDGSQLWRISPLRWTLLAATVLFTTGLVAMSLRPIGETQVGGWLSNTNVRNAILIVCAVLFCAAGLLLATPLERIGRFAGYLNVLRPLVIWGMMMALQTLAAVLIWIGFKIRQAEIVKRKSTLIAAAVFLGLLMVLVIFIGWSRIGLAPDWTGWNAPGTPVLFSQVLLACGIGIVVFMLTRRFGMRQDIFISLVLWSVATVIWLSAPAQPTFFSPKVRPPNFQPYPFSDSAYYDLTSQTILNGKSDETGLLRKPLYDFFLAFLHVFAGQNYEAMISLQVLILAVIPVLMYLLAAQLGGRLAGLIAAMLVILRERNSIVLTNVIEVSSARLLLSDVPSMLLMLLVAVLMVRWLSRPEGSLRLAFATGAALGLLILIRTQAFALVPVVLVCSLLVHLRHWKPFLASGLLMVLGVTCAISPWMWRNYAVTGQWSVEDTGSYMGMMVGAFADVSPQGITRQPDESNAEYDARLRGIVIKGFFLHPERILGFTSSHFIHNELQSFLHLPLSASLQTPKAYVKSLPFWNAWSAPWPVSIYPFLLVNLILLAFGLGAAWSRNHMVSLTPVFLSLGYSLTVAAARFSGWRYILPADWIVIVFYALGLSQVFLFIWVLFKGLFPKIQIGSASQPSTPPARPRVEMAVIGMLVLIGLSLPVSEILIPERYANLSPAQKVELYNQRSADQNLPSTASVEELLKQPNAVALYGEALYPRYYRAGGGQEEKSSSAYVIRDYNRIGFLLLVPGLEQVILAVRESPPAFPHAEQVLIIGCRIGGYVQALLIVPADPQAGPVFTSVSASETLDCPSSAP